MSLTRMLIRNVVSNWIGYAVQAAVAFALTPFILHSLGETRYGIWTLAMGLTGYYGLLDLGFSAGITQYLTRYLASKDTNKLNGAASSGFIGLTCCGLFVLFVCIVLALKAPALFQIPTALNTEVTVVIAITGASVAIQFVFFTYSAVFTAVQRFDLSNGIGIITRILSAVATVVCLKLGYGLIGLSLAVAVTNLIDYLLRWRVAVRLLPSLKVSVAAATRREFKDIMTFGVWNLLFAGSVRMVSYTDSLVIATFMPIAAVAPFAIAASLRSYFEDIFIRVGYVFFPAVTELDAKGDREGLKTLYLTSSRFMLLGSIGCGSLAVCWSRDFFRLWLGPTYVVSGEYPSIASLFYLLLLGSMATVAQRIGHQILQGMRRMSLVAGLSAVEGVINFVISIALVKSYGLFGVAMGTLLPAILFQGFVQPIVVCRLLEISLNHYCREVLLRPMIVVVLLVPGLLTLRLVDPLPYWSGLFIWGGISSVAAFVIVVSGGLTKSERDVLLKQPVTVGIAKFRAVLST